MSKNTIVLKDNNYKCSNISISLKHKNTYVEDDLRTIIFDLTVTYEDNTINDEFVLFSSEIDQLNNLTDKLDKTEYAFYEPNISFTVFESITTDIIFYLNFDSGLNYSNSPSDSGPSIRLEVDKNTFVAFINEIKSYLQ
ncbi:hypothetical protein E4T73_01595 [Staphylococcus arlettae]|uniref:hypothetical protein n=1 Tax=Staphylococcus arlettae TaxID=29378 RepID=UPI00107214A7|nr:hypothetical protein [Staphylococcus arlettae]MBF0736854.1 hypothetical protein [Staphylococcus arlettae]MBK3720214.1 hypothetical protein [Staphylococcus arlettae]TFU48422.1 hypothetical protein E4T73_01595 [Staphylococcus arlettae]